MKKYILLFSAACMFSCNDLFDKTNLESMGSDIVWQDPGLHSLFGSGNPGTRKQQACL